VVILHVCVCNVCSCQDDKGGISSPSSCENLVDAGSKFAGSRVGTSEAAAASAANDIIAEPRPIPPGLPAVGFPAGKLSRTGNFDRIYPVSSSVPENMDIHFAL